jgi:hypothetical protein
VVEGAPLLREYTREGIVGSNPIFSAIFLSQTFLLFSERQRLAVRVARLRFASRNRNPHLVDIRFRTRFQTTAMNPRSGQPKRAHNPGSRPLKRLNFKGL